MLLEAPSLSSRPRRRHRRRSKARRDSHGSTAASRTRLRRRCSACTPGEREKRSGLALRERFLASLLVVFESNRRRIDSRRRARVFRREDARNSSRTLLLRRRMESQNNFCAETRFPYSVRVVPNVAIEKYIGGIEIVNSTIYLVLSLVLT